MIITFHFLAIKSTVSDAASFYARYYDGLKTHNLKVVIIQNFFSTPDPSLHKPLKPGLHHPLPSLLLLHAGTFCGRRGQLGG